MPAVSKAQQRFMGMVHATQKGDMEAPSKEVEKAADSMKKSDAKDFASTKHKGLPTHVREFIKSVIREVLKGEGAFGSVVDPYDARNLGETSERDVHFKAIMKMYDNGGPFTKKKVGVAVSKNPNVSRNRIVDDLKDMDYTEITDVQDELRIKESTNEAQAVSGGKVNKFITGKNVTLKGKKHSEVDFELVGIDNQKQTVKLKVLAPTELFGQEINIDFRTLRRGPFLKTDTSKAESVNEAKPAVVGNVNAFGPSKVLGKGGKVLGFVPDTPNAIATLIQDYPNVQAIEFKSPFFLDFKTYKSIKKGDKAWKELMNRGVDKATKAALKKDFQLKESVKEVITNPKKTNPSDLAKTVLGWFDFYTDYIDDGGQRRRALKNNEDTLVWFGSHPKDVKEKAYKIMLSQAKSEKGQIEKTFGKHLKESVNEGLYFVGYNKGRGQGTGVFKDSYSSYKDAKKAVEKLEKERGGSYNQIAYYVADKDGKFVRESVNEAAGKEAMGIAGFTGTRGDAVQKFIDTNNINAEKLFNFVKKGKLSDRMDFVKALVGNPNNPVQKKIIKMFGESVTEEHDCGCNENHDCGCGGLHEH